jgi:hypothetical protein
VRVSVRVGVRVRVRVGVGVRVRVRVGVGVRGRRLRPEEYGAKGMLGKAPCPAGFGY